MSLCYQDISFSLTFIWYVVRLFLNTFYLVQNFIDFFRQNFLLNYISYLQELCKVPRLVVEGVSCDDLNQGEIGNTWFVTACASLTLEKKLFERVSKL